MPAKTHRSAVTKHSRNGSTASSTKIAAGPSSTKLNTAANLHFTAGKGEHHPRQKDRDERAKKSGHLLDSHSRPVSPFPRAGSSQRIKSREHIQPLQKQTQHRPANKPGRGFHMGSPDSDDSAENDDEDAWTSESASGAATPSGETDDETDDEDLRQILNGPQRPVVPRIETAREVGGFEGKTPPATRDPPVPQSVRAKSQPASTAALAKIQTTQHQHQQTNGRATHVRTQSHTQPPTPPSPATSRQQKRHSSHRPPSMHSIHGHPPLRPHPLIRGTSFGVPTTPGAGPSGLAPLTVISDSARAEVATPNPLNELSSSPTASLRSIASPNPSLQSSPGKPRRTSVSSVATLPVPASPNPAASILHATQQRDSRERHRTMSTLSTSSSTAAISQLFHLPSLSRAPSPPHGLSTNPFANVISKFGQSPYMHTDDWGADVLANADGSPIHTLLPTPYMQTHQNTLARRAPLYGSWVRVVNAKGYATR